MHLLIIVVESFFLERVNLGLFRIFLIIVSGEKAVNAGNVTGHIWAFFRRKRLQLHYHTSDIHVFWSVCDFCTRTCIKSKVKLLLLSSGQHTTYGGSQHTEASIQLKACSVGRDYENEANFGVKKKKLSACGAPSARRRNGSDVFHDFKERVIGTSQPSSPHVLIEMGPDGLYRLGMRPCPRVDEVCTVVNTQVRVALVGQGRIPSPFIRHDRRAATNVPLYEWY
uniref:Uncharacterized protein n=1 Tax=Trichuris muris TaxID=70415 RepID=A0A5S6Q5Y2_TRIMR